MNPLTRLLTRPLLGNREPALTPERRIAWVDITKFFGIIIVVWYHTGIASMHAINIFIMPLFFILSGIFFAPQLPPREFLRRRSRSLLLPFIFFMVLSLAVEAGVYGMRHYNNPPYDADIFMRLNNVPLWFLFTIIYVYFIAWGIEMAAGARRWFKWALIALVTGAAIAMNYTSTRLPLFISQACGCFPFFMLGYLLRDRWKNGTIFNLPLLLAALACIIITFHPIGLVNYHRFIFEPGYPLCFVGAVAWCYIIIFITHCLSRLRMPRPVLWIGASTLMIMGLHMLLMNPIYEYGTTHLPHLFPDSYNGRLHWELKLLHLVIAIVVTFAAAALGALIRRLLPRLFPSR